MWQKWTIFATFDRTIKGISVECGKYGKFLLHSSALLRPIPNCGECGENGPFLPHSQISENLPKTFQKPDHFLAMGPASTKPPNQTRQTQPRDAPPTERAGTPPQTPRLSGHQAMEVPQPGDRSRRDSKQPPYFNLTPLALEEQSNMPGGGDGPPQCPPINFTPRDPPPAGTAGGPPQAEPGEHPDRPMGPSAPPSNTSGTKTYCAEPRLTSNNGSA